MMSFHDTQTVYIKDVASSRVLSESTVVPIVTTYPFNSPPAVALVADLRVEWLEERIRIDKIDTYILDKAGSIVVHAGALPLSEGDLAPLLGKDISNDVVKIHNMEYRVSNLVSSVNGWNYVSIVSEKEFMGPANRIRVAMSALLLFLLAVGIAVSYSVGYRMYTPIRTITNQIAGRDACARAATVNEYDFLSDWYRKAALDSRNMQRVIEGMRPVLLDSALLRLLNGSAAGFDAFNSYCLPDGPMLEEDGKKLVLCLQRIPLSEPDAAARTAADDESFLVRRLVHVIPTLGRQVYAAEAGEDTVAVVWVNTENHSPERIAQTLARACAGGLPGKSVVAVSNRFDHSAAELAQSYALVHRLLDYRFFNEQNELITEQTAEERMYGDTYLSEAFVNKLRSTKEPKALFAVIDEILIQYDTDACVAKNARLIALDILKTLIRSSPGRRYMGLEKTMAYTTLVERCGTTGALRGALRTVCSQEFAQPAHGAPVPQNEVVRQAMEYIREHFAQELSLVLLAERYHMSVGHFSRCFKKYAGEKYVDFINQCRIEESKRLLVGTDIILDEISTRVGYMGGNSFNSIFKRYVGITPGKYRALHRQA